MNKTQVPMDPSSSSSEPPCPHSQILQNAAVEWFIHDVLQKYPSHSTSGVTLLILGFITLVYKVFKLRK